MNLHYAGVSGSANKTPVLQARLRKLVPAHGHTLVVHDCYLVPFRYSLSPVVLSRTGDPNQDSHLDTRSLCHDFLGIL